MASKTLVKRMLGSGRRLIEEMRLESMDVSLAAWVKLHQDGSWYLFLTVAKFITDIDSAKYAQVTEILGRNPDTPISHLEVSLIAEETTWARVLAEIRDSHPVQGIFHHRPSNSSGFVEAYIYPRVDPEAEVRTGGRHGARVILLDDAVALVRQTVKRAGPEGQRYSSDAGRMQLVPLGDDAALGAAIRAALEGRMSLTANARPEPVGNPS